ncbi:hypothetical protein EDD86DRAFT_210579 [Gorgonomyces haynaldii]|nr:hypothetical protein EDD86DRAFT_210579 [Gorgonomyces haynaldii]
MHPPPNMRLIHRGKLLKTGLVELSDGFVHLVIDTVLEKKPNPLLQLSPGTKLVVMDGIVYAMTTPQQQPPPPTEEPIPVHPPQPLDDHLGGPRVLFVNALWLVAKLGFMLFVFAHNGSSWYRLAFFYLLAFAIFLVQLGLFPIPNFDGLFQAPIVDEDQTLLGAIANIGYTFVASLFVEIQHQD